MKWIWKIYDPILDVALRVYVWFEAWAIHLGAYDMFLKEDEAPDSEDGWFKVYDREKDEYTDLRD